MDFTKVIRMIKSIYLAVKSLVVGHIVTFKNLFAKKVTLQYPTEKMPMTDRFRGLVDLYPEKCVVCYQCVKICPTAALDLGHRYDVVNEKKKLAIEKFRYDIELCCFCGLCAEICPTEAMVMSKVYEASTYGHAENKIDLMNPDKYKEWETKPNPADIKKTTQEAVKK